MARTGGCTGGASTTVVSGPLSSAAAPSPECSTPATVLASKDRGRGASGDSLARALPGSIDAVASSAVSVIWVAGVSESILARFATLCARADMRYCKVNATSVQT